MKTTACPNPECQGDVPITWETCPHCAKYLGAPNVRMAELPEEVQALDNRYQQALSDALVRNVDHIVAEFETALASSKAVMSLPVAEVQRIAKSDTAVAATFYDRGKLYWDKGSNVFEGSNWNAIRPAAEAAFFGDLNKDKIHFAALTVNDRGLENYGESPGNCFVILKESHTADRISAIEENMLVFLKKHGSQFWIDEKLPAGFRSSWSQRARIAVAKLAHKIETSTTQGDFAGILIVNGATSADDEFIELHLYGSMTARTFEKVVIEQAGSKKKKRPSNAIVKKLKRQLNRCQVPLLQQ